MVCPPSSAPSLVCRWLVSSMAAEEEEVRADSEARASQGEKPPTSRRTEGEGRRGGEEGEGQGCLPLLSCWCGWVGEGGGTSRGGGGGEGAAAAPSRQGGRGGREGGEDALTHHTLLGYSLPVRCVI